MTALTVLCPGCGSVNQPGRRFCGGCATALPLACSVCSAENPTEDRFCGYCATALAGSLSNPQAIRPAGDAAALPVRMPSALTQPSSAPVSLARTPLSPRPPASPPTPMEERRLVIALFGDSVGFTPIAERLDPKEVRDLQGRYFEQVRALIECFDGTVEKYAGDSVLALFGVPAAYEDDAERAALCAQGIQSAIEPVAATARERWQVEPAIRVSVIPARSKAATG